MRTRIPYLFLSLIALPFVSTAQIDLSINEKEKKGFLYFKELNQDFGTWNEAEGTKTLRFVGHNLMKYPLAITNVVVACGCTAVDWQKDTLYFGDSTILEVSYNPENKPGPFEKPIFVYTNGIPYQIMLTIKGEVIKREKVTADNYPTNYGNLRLTAGYLNFGFMYRDQIDTLRIGLYNTGDSTIRIKGISGRPPYIYTNTPNIAIKPGEETFIELIYDARLANDYGDMFHFLYLLTDDYYAQSVPISINAHLLERFPKQTKRRIRTNPKVSFDREEHEFGKVLKGDTVTAEFRITNQGKRKLIIRKLQPSCGCTATNIDKMELGPGETATIIVSFNTAGRSGEDTKSITIITNDPARPVAKIFLKGEIVQNPNAL